MARVSIKFQQVQTANQTLKRMLTRLDTAENDLAAIRRALPAEVKGRYSIDTRLERQRSEVAALRRQVDQLLQVAEAGVESYRTAEYRLDRSVPYER